MLTTQEINTVIKKLKKAYPNTKPSLRFRSAFELLIAVILSAQCTDERVNKVTKELFPKDKACTPDHILKLGEKNVMKIIYPTGYYNSKTKALMGTAAAVKKLGKVPSTIEEMTKLPGVGRKTAQVIQAQWFDLPAFPVDTHVHRVANRIGFANTGKNRDKTERELKAQVPKKLWSELHLLFIYHGRETCSSRSPKCAACPVYKECKWKDKLKI